MSSFTVPVDGLHCDGCVRTVTEELSALEGVRSVSVDLNTKGVSQVHIDADAEIPDDRIQAAIAAEGNFTVAR